MPRRSYTFTAAILVTTLLSSAFSQQAYACACGCGVFDVGTSGMLPTHEGGMVFIEYDFMNQNKNWHGTSSAPAADNDDKDIKTNFYTVGGQYMFNRSWGIEAQVPYWQRHFTTTDDSSNIVQFDHASIGDVRLKGIYSGFSEDMSSGLTFGLKLPTGSYTQNGFDRDTSIGSGSTDILLGAYHMGSLAGAFNWFGNAQWDQPVLTRGNYRPGSEVDVGAGVYYHGWSVQGIRIAPLAQLINSYRLQDRGLNANHDNSGYERVLFSPGIEFDTGSYRLYGDVGIPVYQHVKGEQLTAPVIFKLNISRSF